jgi:RNA polymerase-binding transcription factor DksA
MSADRTLTMAEIRWLVSEMNSERGRLERSLAMSEDDASDGAVAVQSQTAARRDALVAALERVRDGTYGVCERCGHDIPFGRLLVIPEVTHCVACQKRP